ncbi:discoidin domain-containing protein [Paenibacillus sp. TC-CSREp1]|uniref:discoidin domain-containing protein n=1 Tax=Paenibacillus sp. TC-CSREp1 TaxID=3410089 RepID=UPI003CE780B5
MPVKVSNVIPKMTSNTAPSGVVSASSIYSSAYDSWYAFNQTNDQGWASSGTTIDQWLCYHFAYPIAISQYTITSRNSTTSSDLLQSPKKWRFEASNDGLIWTKIDERDNITNWGVAEKRVFTFNNNIKFQYYRIYCISNNGSTTAFAINELEMMEYDYLSKILLSSGGRAYSVSQDIFSTEIAIPPMTSNTAPSGEVSASSQYTATTYYPYFAFNQTNTGAGDCWVTANGQTTGWLQYKFNIPKVISKYAITNRNNGNVYDNTPKSWTFEGSTDGVNWVVLDRIENNPAWTSVESRNFNFKNETSYLYYRLSVTVIHSGTYLAIGKLEMYEYIKGFVYSLPSSDEETFIKYGVDQIKLNSLYGKKVSMEKIKVVLGSGKTFEHTVDMSKRRVDKIKLG